MSIFYCKKGKTYLACGGRGESVAASGPIQLGEEAAEHAGLPELLMLPPGGPLVLVREIAAQPEALRLSPSLSLLLREQTLKPTFLVEL